MGIREVLEEIGLSRNEVKVYLALLELGSSLAGAITKKSEVHRANVYDALERLMEKGIVSYVMQGGRKYFEAGEVDRLMGFLEEQEKEVKEKKEKVEGVLKELRLKRKLSKESQEATVYKGRKGLKMVAEDVLKVGKEMLVFGAEGKFVSLFTHYAEQWHTRRGKSKIKLKIVYNPKLREVKLKSKFPFTQMKFSKMVGATPATTWVYGDKVAIIVWGEQPLATVIRSKEVSCSYKTFFEELWKGAKR